MRHRSICRRCRKSTVVNVNVNVNVNSLPVEVVNAHSVTIFKNLINNIDFSRFLHCSYFS